MGKQAAKNIIHHLNLECNTEHPFIIKRMAQGTSYSTLEKKRIQQVIHRKRFQLFEKLGIEEECGDRVLLLGLKLSEDKYRKWLLRCNIPGA
jgi:hypothetical protein